MLKKSGDLFSEDKVYYFMLKEEIETIVIFE